LQKEVPNKEAERARAMRTQSLGKDRTGYPVFHPSTGASMKTLLTPRQRNNSVRNEKRRARRLASRTAVITVWWNGQPNPRPDFYTPLSLALALGKPSNRFAPALRWLGWRCIHRLVHGSKATLWLPPTSTIQPRPRGRPRLYDF